MHTMHSLSQSIGSWYLTVHIQCPHIDLRVWTGTHARLFETSDLTIMEVRVKCGTTMQLSLGADQISLHIILYRTAPTCIISRKCHLRMAKDAEFFKTFQPFVKVESVDHPQAWSIF